MTKLAIIALSQCPTASCPKRPFKYELWFFMFNSTSDCSSIEGKLFAPDEIWGWVFLFLLHLPLSPTFSFISWDKYRCRQFIVDMFHDKRPKQERDKSCQKCNKKKETKHSSAFGRWRFKVAVPKTTTCQLEHSQRQLNWTERDIIQVSSLQNLSQCCRYTHL